MLLQVSVAKVKFLQVMFLLPTATTTNAYYSWNEVRTLLLIYLDGFADFSQFYDAIAPLSQDLSIPSPTYFSTLQHQLYMCSQQTSYLLFGFQSFCILQDFTPLLQNDRSFHLKFQIELWAGMGPFCALDFTIQNH